MILKRVLKLSFLFQRLCELWVDIYISDIAVLKIDAEVVEFLVQIFNHLGRHLALQVKHLAQPYPVDERADALVYLRIQQLVKTGGPQLVHEVLGSPLILRHPEGKIQIDVNVCIVFRWAIVYL